MEKPENRYSSISPPQSSHFQNSLPESGQVPTRTSEAMFWLRPSRRSIPLLSLPKLGPRPARGVAEASMCAPLLTLTVTIP
jgi:hypothetical protein